MDASDPKNRSGRSATLEKAARAARAAAGDALDGYEIVFLTRDQLRQKLGHQTPGVRRPGAF